MTRIAHAVLALTLCACSTAWAGQWSGPRAIPHSAGGTPLVAFDAQGQGLIAWDGFHGDTREAAIARGDVVGPTRVASPLTVDTPDAMELSAGGLVVAAANAVPEGTNPSRILTGRPGSTLALGAPGPVANGVSIAVEPSGAAAVAETVCEPHGQCPQGYQYCNEGCTPNGLELTRGDAASGRWGQPLVITQGGPVGAAAVAMNDRGDLVLAWQEGNGAGGAGGLYALLLASDGSSSQITQLGECDSLEPDIEVLMTPSGKAVVAWTCQGVSNGSITGPGLIAVAVSTPDSLTFAPTQVLERFDSGGGDPYLSGRSMALAQPDGGREAVDLAWTGFAHGRFDVRASVLAGDRFTDTRTLSAPGSEAFLGAMAAGPRGELLALWTSWASRRAMAYAQPPDVDAVVAGPAPGGVAPLFGAPEVVARETAALGAFAALAYDPRSDRPMAVFTNGHRIHYMLRAPTVRPPARSRAAAALSR